jgi:hypothetical protein
VDASAELADTTTTVCPECGALLPANTSCHDIFGQLLALEYQYPQSFGAVHHLMVMSYNVQHPGAYTDDFWNKTVAMLNDVVEQEISGAQLRKRMQHELAAHQGRMSIKIKGTPERAHQHAWTMRAVDVVTDDPQVYIERVWQWARSIVATLEQELQV